MPWLVLATLAALWLWTRTPSYEAGVDSDTPPARRGRYPGELVKFAEPGRTGFANPQYGWRWTEYPPGSSNWAGYQWEECNDADLHHAIR